MTASEWLSNRYFRGLSDEELYRVFVDRTLDWRNTPRANREVRRRAAKCNLSSPYDWLSEAKMRYGK